MNSGYISADSDGMRHVSQQIKQVAQTLVGRTDIPPLAPGMTYESQRFIAALSQARQHHYDALVGFSHFFDSAAMNINQLSESIDAHEEEYVRKFSAATDLPAVGV